MYDCPVRSIERFQGCETGKPAVSIRGFGSLEYGSYRNETRFTMWVFLLWLQRSESVPIRTCRLGSPGLGLQRHFDKRPQRSRGPLSHPRAHACCLENPGSTEAYEGIHRRAVGTVLPPRSGSSLCPFRGQSEWDDRQRERVDRPFDIGALAGLRPTV